MQTTLPRKVGDIIEFSAHGNRFTVKKKDAGLYVAMEVGDRSHSRWGDSREIRADIKNAIETGKLPRPRFSGF